MEHRCHAMLDAADDAGVRYIDAARSYGMAEAFLSRWLAARSVDRDSLTVGSKWGYTYVADWQLDASVHETKDLTASTLRRQAAESRSWLGTWLRLYQIHSATLESGVLSDVEVLSELARLRSEGLAIGLTVTGPRQGDTIRRALDVRVDGFNPFQVVQATWNLLEPSAGTALADAHASGWGIIVKEALANGRLTTRGAPSSEVSTFATACGVDVGVAAIAAALNQPWADVVLSGAVTPEQPASNLTALDVDVPSSEWPSMAQPPEVYWTARSELRWR